MQHHTDLRLLVVAVYCINSQGQIESKNAYRDAKMLLGHLECQARVSMSIGLVFAILSESREIEYRSEVTLSSL